MRYFRPTTLADALAIRSDTRATILSGGTDVYPAAATRRAWGDPIDGDILDISAVPGLTAIEHTGDGWRFGSRVTWTQLIEADLPPLFDGYKAAAREVGGAQVQNVGTLVGNLCTASPAGDGIPNLLVLEAEVELASVRGTRRMAVENFLAGYRKTGLGADEIVTALVIRDVPHARGRFAKLGARRYLVISIAMVAAVMVVSPTGAVETVRVAIGACSASAQRCRALEETVLGMPWKPPEQVVESAHFDALSPIDDIRASAAYRRAAAEAMTRDLLERLAADGRAS